MKWLTALDLEHWAQRIDARAVFPGLISDLIRASATDITSFRFATGAKSQIRGFDGSLESNGALPFVPAGKSIWEFGCSEATEKKANEDYEKRTAQVTAEVRANTTFVIASPYTWDAPKKKIDDWLKEKREEKQWKQVEYLDGISIEKWLDEHPAVSARYARYELGLQPKVGVLSIEEFWEVYSTRFNPQLSEDVLLCDRQAQVEKLLKALGDSQGIVTFAADSPDEVIAFAVAAIRKSEPATRLFLEARTIIVETEEAARLMAVKKGLAFLPKGRARLSAGLLVRAGATIVGLGRNEPKANSEILNRPTTSSMGDAIATMGFTKEVGYQLARQCGRSVTILGRLIASGSAEQPEWIGQKQQLLPALLAGGWNAASKLDTDILCNLGNAKDYEEVEAPLRSLTQLADPPIDRIDDVWRMRAPVDAFVYIGHIIGVEDLNRFEKAATEVFGKSVEPPKPDELFSLDRKPPTLHSDWLREGLATTLLQIAVLHDQTKLVIPGNTPQNYVNDIIRKLPGLSTNHRLLTSLHDQLPLLMEAAPVPFLEALEQLLGGDGALLQPIFDEQVYFITPSSPHTGLLWALEVLAWDPALLPRVVLVLAKLAAIDPGGRLSNRPINSLRSIFLSWSPNTNATLKQRLAALDHVMQNLPVVGWELLVTLLPKPYDTSSPTSKPKYREAGSSETEKLTYGLVWESQREIISRALVQAAGVAERLIVIIKSVHSFELSARFKALDVIEKFLDSHDQAVREPLWVALRDEANKNKAFADTDWAMKGKVLDRIDEIVNKYQPSDLITLNVWLFDDWSPNVPGKLDDMERTLTDARTRAVNTVMKHMGIEGVLLLVDKAKLPHFIATALDYVDIDVANFGELVERSIGRPERFENFASVVSSVAYKKYNSQWIEIIKKMADRNKWPFTVVAKLLVTLPDERPIWDIVKDFGPEIEIAYWRNKHPFHVKGTHEDLIFLANKYLEVDRPVAAIEALHRQNAEVPTSLLLTLLDATLKEMNRHNKVIDSNMFAYYIEHIFESLEDRTDVNAMQLAQLEYAYLPILDRQEKQLTLHRLLMQNPELYVSAIKDVFKPASGEMPEPSEEDRLRANVSYRLLNSIEILPGQIEDKIDFEVLQKWCNDVRKKAAYADRATIADQYIGHILAHAPVEKADNCWPHIAVRRLLEELQSEEIERGLTVERHNMRGVFTKSLDEGGAQERALAEEARTWARAMTSYQRTASLLMRIAESWDWEAKQEDIRMEQQRLRW